MPDFPKFGNDLVSNPGVTAVVSHVRPKRALRRALPFRPAALAVPAVIVGLLGSGAAVSAWSPVSADAQPAAVAAPASGSSTVRDGSDRVSRMLDDGRPALSDRVRPAGSDQQAANAKAEQEAAAEAKAEAMAAEQKAAQKKAEKAAEKKAAQQQRAREEAVAKKKAAAQRVTPTRVQLEASGHRYTRVNLNVRSQPSSSARLVTVLPAGRRLAVTDTTKSSWTLVIYRDQGRWVRTRNLTTTEPQPAEAKSASTGSANKSSTAGKSSSAGKASTASSSGLSMAPCSSGSGMESGLTRDAIRVHRAVCERFPQVRSYGGLRSGGDSFHSSGRAVDIMISGETGWDIARWVRSNRKQLGVSEIIYAQRIWTVQRSSEGWRPMASRGNPTANHYDHVHVSVYGNKGTS